MEDDNFITKLPIDESSDHIILHTVWNEESIRFEVLNLSEKGDNELTGDLLIEDLKTSANELSIPFERFSAETKEALTKPNGHENFCYTIEDSKFIWRKKEKFKVVYGEVSLLPAQNLKELLILDSIRKINKLRDDYQLLHFEYQKQNVEFKTYAESLKKCVDQKNHLEKNLLTKFCALLNSKKDKIAELQQLLKEKNSRLPEERNSSEDDGGQIYNQPTDDLSTQINTNSSRKGLLLPKRRKNVEATSNSLEMEIDERTKPSCSGVNEINKDEMSNIDDILDNL